MQLPQLLLVTLCVSPVLSQTLTLQQKTCDAARKHTSVQTTNANVLLAGIFDIRDTGTGGSGCGLPNRELMQVYEAARWTISQLNSNNYVNGIRFGLEAFDTCNIESNTLTALQTFYPQAAGRDGTSSAGTNYCSKSPTVYKMGVIGPMQSATSITLARVAPLIPASIISFRSASPALSNKNLYPTFLRTHQSSNVFARAVTQMLKELQWEKIVIVYSDNAYGVGGYTALLKAANEAGICVSGVIGVPDYGTVAENVAKLRNIAAYGATAAVYYGNTQYTTIEALQSLQNQPGVRDIKWLFQELDLERDYSSFTSAQGLIAVPATTTTISSFKSYFTNLNVNNPSSENPWLQDWYMNVYKCKLTGVNYAPFNTMPACQTTTNPRVNDFRQSQYVENTILSILAYAEAIKKACAGSPGMCQTLKNMNPLTFHKNYLSKVDYTFPSNFFIPEFRNRRLAFDVNGNIQASAFTFYNYNNKNGPFNFEEFAKYTNGVLQMTSTPVFPRTGSPNLPLASKCPTNGCTNCLQSTQKITMAYKPGDFVVMALVDAHDPRAHGLTCGEVIPDRLIDAVAARYGVDQSTVLRTRQLTMGYLIVDMCPGMAAAQSFLTNLLGGYAQYTDSNGVIIPTNNIVAVLDMTREDTGWKIAPTLASMSMPQIRIAPTSNMFLHNPSYPNLISAVPSQDTVQLSIAQMLAFLKFKYIQIVSESEGSYYRAAENFRRVASRMNICVAMWATFNMEPSAIVSRLRETQAAPIVVVFGSSNRLRSLLEAVKTATAPATSQRQLTFVSGSEEFGGSENVVAGYNNEASGSIFVQLSQISNPQMNSWLTGLSLSDIANDPFLAKWVESKFSCSLTTSSRTKYDKVCPSTTTISSTNSVYQGYAPYIISGINSVAEAIDSILRTTCETGTGTGTGTGICPKFRGLKDLGDSIVADMMNTNENTEFEIMKGVGMSDMTYYNFKNAAFSNVGTFDTDNERISRLIPRDITLGNGKTADTVSTACAGSCSQCQYMYNYQEFGYMPGDWLIGGLFSISNPGPEGQRPFVCSNVQTSEGFQFATAMMYALDRINSGLGPVKLNNVTLGSLIMDHCDNPRRAYGQVSDIYSGLTALTWKDRMGNTRYSDFMRPLAWLTDDTASTQEAAEILQPLGVSIVSPSATSSTLMDNPTFFRTVQGDAAIAMAIIKLCKTLGFSYLQVVHAASDYGTEGRDTLINTARQEGLCVINSYQMDSSSNATHAVDTVAAGSSRVVILYLDTPLATAFLQEAAKRNTDRLTIISSKPYTDVVTSTSIPNRNSLTNLLTFQLQNPEIADYTNYLNNIQQNSKNPYFARYYMQMFACNLPGYYLYSKDCLNLPLTSGSAFQPTMFSLSTINAVYAIAAALQTTLVEVCGSGYSGGCEGFLKSSDSYLRFVDNLKVIDFQDPSNRPFRFLEREGNVVYDVMQFNGAQYQKVGTYGGASLILFNPSQLTADYTNVISECPSLQCSECVFNNVQFSYTAGDIYLAGIFDVHVGRRGVFDCGEINTLHGFQLLEAFHFAIQQVNSKKGIFADILNGVTLGGIGLDSCQSAIRGGYLVSNINNGLMSLVRDGKEIQPDEIDVYIGPYSSDSSIYLARILTDLKTPQISYAASSNLLDDELIYPYFFRTVPTDDKQVLGMLEYLDQANIRYVQVLYTGNAYGEQGMDQFDRLIRERNYSICVAQRVEFPYTGIVSQETSNDVVRDLLQKPVANTVVIFADTDYIREFLKAVERSEAASKRFKFLGPTTWGDRYEVVDGIRGVAHDSVTFMLDFQGGVGGFISTYLEKRNPTNAVNNPWFEEWFQYMLNCYTTPINAGRYPAPCGSNVDLQGNVVEDNGILHVMNAVYSAAFAIDATLKQKCGNNYAAVCEVYRSSKDRRTLIRDNLDQVNFTDPTNTEFRFIERSGNKGYRLIKLTSSPLDADVVYNRAPIGTFSSDNTLTLDLDLAPKYDGSCDRKDACVECPTVRERGVRFAVGGDPDGDTTLIGLFDVHNRGSEFYQCGSINIEGFMKFFTFFMTYNKEAASSKVRLLALDTCSNSLRAGQDLYNLLKDGTLCNSPSFDLNKLGLANIGAVVVTGEENTAVVSRLLEPLKVTYISSDSVSPWMDDRQYLLRSRTPWSGFVSVLSKFLVDNEWTYINSIYLDSDMGREKYGIFRDMSGAIDICLSNSLALSESASDDDIRAVLGDLDSSSGANVVVLFSPPPLSMRILRLAQELGIADDYLWIFAVDSPDILKDIPAGVTFQALIFEPSIPQQYAFKEDFEKLSYNPFNNNRNQASVPRVWWEDFYQTVHQCHLETAVYPLDYSNECTLNLTFKDFNYNSSYHYTLLASVFSMRGLEAFYRNCISGETLEACLRRMVRSRLDIRDNIMLVRYQKGSKQYLFNRPKRYIETDYKILRVDVENGMMKGAPMLFKTYSGGKFLVYGLVDRTSTCQKYGGCRCKKEDPFAKPQTAPEFIPTMPRNYYKYSQEGEKMYEWPIWAIVVGVLTCVGLLTTILAFLYLLFAYPVKGGTSVLGYLTMIGIMGIYAINFAFFLRASDATCGARRFMMGVVYSIVFGSLLVKSVDNWRFADMEYSNNQYRGITNSISLFLMALGIVLIQCIIPIEWLILVHPTARKWSLLDMHDYWWCDPPDFYDIGLVLSFIFIIFLVVLTAVFAGLAFDSESNNRESRWILVSAISTAGCFLVWMIVTTNAGPIYRDPAVAIANFVNATLLLIFIPMRKMYLLCLSKNEYPEDMAPYDPYNNMYVNQSYDPEGDDYTYEPTDKQEDGFIGED